jgi:diaminopimelate decarboxylase
MGEPAPIDLTLLPRSAAIDASGRLAIAGCDLVELAERFGTPLFVYDEDEIRARCREYASCFRGAVAYASKAFLCTAMARIVYEEGLDIDVASGGELHVVLRAGVPAERIVMHGNNKSTAELRAALQARVKHVVLDSTDEFVRIGSLVRDEHLEAPSVLVRVNPGVDAHTHEYLTTGAVDSKFGVPIIGGSALHVVQRIVETNIARFGGLHVHIGSQIFRRDGFAAAIDRVVALVAAIEREVGVTVDEINLGGGLGVRYTRDDDPVSIAEHAALVHEDFAGTVAAAGLRSMPRLATEPGRSIVAPAGVTLYRVGTIKRLPAGTVGATPRIYVSVDGGMSDNPRPALYGAEYEAFLPARAAAARSEIVTVAGKHCEQGDVLARSARLPTDTAVDDVLCMPCTGAYGYSMASNYNKLPRPAVVFVRGGEARVVVRRETDDDLTRLDVEP